MRGGCSCSVDQFDHQQSLRCRVQARTDARIACDAPLRYLFAHCTSASAAVTKSDACIREKYTLQLACLVRKLARQCCMLYPRLGARTMYFSGCSQPLLNSENQNGSLLEHEDPSYGSCDWVRYVTSRRRSSRSNFHDASSTLRGSTKTASPTISRCTDKQRFHPNIPAVTTLGIFPNS